MEAYRVMRTRLAKKLNDPQLATIRLYDFRHYFGTMRYHKTREVAITAQGMGHRSWNTTMNYVHLNRIIELNTNEGYICKTAGTNEETKTLIETGFEYVTENNETKFFHKRK